MAYIIFVNPAILSNAIDFEGAFPQLLTVTALVAGIGTLIMALWAKLPFALAPGMGLNAYFTFTVVLTLGIPWQTALGAVFISGILFVAIALTGMREWILNAIPLHLKHAITAGIGAFLAIIGFIGAGFATSAALIIIGAMMMTGATKVDWADYRKSIPAFLAIVGMPFTFSITFGISLAIVAHTFLYAVSGKFKEIHVMMWILTVLIIANQTGFIADLFG